MSAVASPLLTPKEALEFFKLKDIKILRYLYQRDLLPRVVLGPKCIRYKVQDCESLLERCERGEVILTAKP
jgi:hypothetical protein